MSTNLQHTRGLAISNIAWPADKDDEAIELAANLGFEGIEIAPGKVFGNLSTLSSGAVRSYRRRIEDAGLAICSLQAILFGIEGAHLFESSLSRGRMADHLRRVAEVAGGLGARACVFGSPTLRDPGTIPDDEAQMIAQNFLRAIAPDFANQGVELCFEANPMLYKCRFVTRTDEALSLVEQVNMPGIAMQLDTGTIFINGEDPDIIARAEHRIGHFHVSEPNLAPIGTTGVDHSAIADTLKASAYAHWLSIEMRAADDWQSAIRQAHALVHSLYCNVNDTK